MRAVVYMRVSSDDQREARTIENQREFAESWARLNEVHVLDWYVDDGVSGALPVEKRPAGSRMMADAQAKRFDTVLIFRIDRLSRSTLQILRCGEALERAGVAIRSMTEPFETATSIGKFMLTMLGSIAQLERDTIKERTTMGRLRGAREGRWSGGKPPIGYRVGEEGRLEIHEPEASLVRRIFRLYQDGLTTTQLAHLLNSENVPTPHQRKARGETAGQRWRDTSVWLILTNHTYSGEREYRRRQQVYGDDGISVGLKYSAPDYRIASPNVAIIEAEVFEEVQLRIQQNRKLANRNSKHDYLLRGLVRCGLCGLGYCGSASTNRLKKEYVYYSCVSKGRRFEGGSCKGKHIPAAELEAAIWQDVSGFCRDPGPVIERLKEQVRAQAVTQEPTREEQVRIEAAMAEAQRGRQKVTGFMRRGILTEEEAENELRTIQKEINALEARRSALFGKQQQAVALELRLVEADALLQRLRGAVEEADFETRRQVVEALVQEVRVDTVEVDGKREAKIAVTYCFECSGASSQLGW